MRVPGLVLLLLFSLFATVQSAAASQRHAAFTPSRLARAVATTYGEHHPRIVHLERTVTDSTPHQSMYFIGMTGHFSKGGKHARTIYFSALSATWHVWGLAAYDTNHHLLWTKTLVPRPRGL